MEEREAFNLVTLKFQMLRQIMDEVFWFGALHFTDAAPFDYFNYIIKKCRTMTFMRSAERKKRW